MKNNVGDDIFVYQLCTRYPNTQFYIAAPDYPNETLEQISNLRFSRKMKSYDREIGSSFLSAAAKRFYSKFDASVIIGGSIFMQSSRNWMDQIQRNQNRLLLSNKLFIIGANFGPYTESRFLIEYSKLFSKVEDICFRDSDSAAYFPEVSSVRWAPDVIFTYPVHESKTMSQVLISVIDCSWAGRPQLAQLSVCKEAYEKKIVEICSAFYQSGHSICLASFCSPQKDDAAAQRIMKECLDRGITDIKITEYRGNISSMVDEISKSKYIIATRFHAMILGLLLGKPTYPIIYDHKQKTVLRDLAFQGKYCSMNDIGNVDAANVVCGLTNYKPFDCKKYILEAQQQFLALDMFINGTGQKARGL